MPARKSVKRRSTKKLIVRVVEPASRRRTAGARAAEEPDDIPKVVIQRKGGPVSIAITFGHAQHGIYTIQLYDPGMTKLACETGSSTDDNPDRFDLKLTPAQLDRHMLQWSGSVDALSNAPGQQYSVIFDVIQGGAVVACGEPCEKKGPLDVTKAFLGVIRLVTSTS